MAQIRAKYCQTLTATKTLTKYGRITNTITKELNKYMLHVYRKVSEPPDVDN